MCKYFIREGEVTPAAIIADTHEKFAAIDNLQILEFIVIFTPCYIKSILNHNEFYMKFKFYSHVGVI